MYEVWSMEVWFVLCCGVTYLNLYHYTQISPLRNSAPKKLDTNGHLISSICFDYNQMGIPVKKRDTVAIYPLS